MPANATLKGLSEGSHTLTVYAGNTGKSETITFTIESFPTSQLITASTVASATVVCFGLLSYLLKFRKRRKSP